MLNFHFVSSASIVPWCVTKTHRERSDLEYTNELAFKTRRYLICGGRGILGRVKSKDQSPVVASGEALYFHIKHDRLILWVDV